MARLARAIDVQQRAAHVMVADLHGADALIRHVAVGAGDARPRVHALIPHLELRVLRLQRGRTRLGVRPVLETGLLVVGENLIGAQPFVPRVGQPLLRPLEVVLDVALPAHIRAHFLARRVSIDVVVRECPAPLSPSECLRGNPGRVTRSCIDVGSWQSMHATGCDTSFRASW